MYPPLCLFYILGIEQAGGSSGGELVPELEDGGVFPLQSGVHSPMGKSNAAGKVSYRATCLSNNILRQKRCKLMSYFYNVYDPKVT